MPYSMVNWKKYRHEGENMAAKQLDGHPGDRIGDLRTNLGMTKKELSQKTGIGASQITRIENGNLKTISSDYLISWQRN